MKVGEIIILTFSGRKILIINFSNRGQRHQTTMCGSPGLSPRLGLLRSQAGPKPTSSPCQGWALAGLEWARLGGLRASSPAQHITNPRARVLQQLPDANKAFLTATMLQHRLRLPDLGVYGIVINNTVSDMLAFGTSKRQFSINVDALDEIARELGVNRSDAAWYVPTMDEDEWDELTE